MRRLVQIQDGDAGVVSAWLGFLRKHQFAGVGMKANVWEWSGVDDVGMELDGEAERLRKVLGERADLVGTREGGVGEEEMERMMLTEPFKGQWGATAAMSANSSVPNANRRIEKEVVGEGVS